MKLHAFAPVGGVWYRQKIPEARIQQACNVVQKVAWKVNQRITLNTGPESGPESGLENGPESGPEK